MTTPDQNREAEEEQKWVEELTGASGYGQNWQDFLEAYFVEGKEFPEDDPAEEGTEPIGGRSTGRRPESRAETNNNPQSYDRPGHQKASQSQRHSYNTHQSQVPRSGGHRPYHDYDYADSNPSNAYTQRTGFNDSFGNEHQYYQPASQWYSAQGGQYQWDPRSGYYWSPQYGQYTAGGSAYQQSAPQQYAAQQCTSHQYAYHQGYGYYATAHPQSQSEVRCEYCNVSILNGLGYVLPNGFAHCNLCIAHLSKAAWVQYELWSSRVSDLLSAGNLTFFPHIPSSFIACTHKNCQAEKEDKDGLRTCVHDVKALFSGLLTIKFLKKERLQWHPDRFKNKCAEEFRETGGALAMKMFVKIGQILDELQANEG
ncbi:hypothetical protein P154DRAFT_574638 [Amniculicola lignicola CBS 123094]|uniref:Uncharacterized protein n=1 Tax=Amniculicola lignicola CBS 123094 TaxID=1392246 RepID=A0A6A5WMH1_9PLEO|nr:hypothetical protein P154DRAFT_574638 [Amniculicola lignicola CBS 123094]